MNDPLTHCPICNNPIDDYDECRTSKPFTAYSPMEGLRCWGAYSVPKETLCYEEGGKYIHFKIGDSERLVLMTEAQ